MNIFENFFLEKKAKIPFLIISIITSIVDDSSNFSICFLKISLISSIVKKSLFDEISLLDEIGVETIDEEHGGGAVKTLEA
jgi:hypothetical protein